MFSSRALAAVAALVTLLALSTPSGSAGNPSPTEVALGAPQELLSYDDALAAGLPVPIFDPDLPICPDVVAPGFKTGQEMESAVDDDAKAVCQADYRKAVVRVGAGRSPTRTSASTRPADTGYHYVGPSGLNYVRHGVRSGIQVKNPDVNHGSAFEHVLGRSLAQAASGYWVEAGWGEFSNGPDKPIAFACFVGTCLDYPSSFPLTVGTSYPFRAHHCGAPGQNRVCGEIWYGGAWMILGSWLTMRCTNSDNSGACRVENLVEIYSEDATPHPSFGGGGITLQNGMLKTTPSSFTLWTTAYGAPTVYAQSPYVISWTSQWSDFKACRDSC